MKSLVAYIGKVEQSPKLSLKSVEYPAQVKETLETH